MFLIKVFLSLICCVNGTIKHYKAVPGGSNIALGKPVLYSSNYGDHASLTLTGKSVVDGDRRDNPPAAFWSSLPEVDPWFVLDLEQNVTVTFIEVLSRGPSSYTQSYNILIYTSLSPTMDDWKLYPMELCTTTSGTYGPFGSLIDGRFIWRAQCRRPASKIVLAMYGYSQFGMAELEVYHDDGIWRLEKIPSPYPTTTDITYSLPDNLDESLLSKPQVCSMLCQEHLCDEMTVDDQAQGLDRCQLRMYIQTKTILLDTA